MKRKTSREPLVGIPMKSASTLKSANSALALRFRFCSSVSSSFQGRLAALEPDITTD